MILPAWPARDGINSARKCPSETQGEVYVHVLYPASQNVFVHNNYIARPRKLLVDFTLYVSDNIIMFSVSGT